MELMLMGERDQTFFRRDASGGASRDIEEVHDGFVPEIPDDFEEKVDAMLESVVPSQQNELIRGAGVCETTESTHESVPTTPSSQFRGEERGTPHQRLEFPPIRRRRSRTYAEPRQARQCHICARRVDLVACSNIRQSTCVKSICRRCFRQYNLDLQEAERNNSTWQCTHCLGSCPRTARCHVYNRTSERRRIRNLTQRYYGQ